MSSLPSTSLLHDTLASLDTPKHIRVWDLPTRCFHWMLALSVIGLVITGLQGAMEWHFRLGYAALALLAFRVLWGFAGGHWSRFKAFAYAPGALLAYLRGRPDPKHLVGHSPLGALSVFALLSLLTLQVATGLFADDEIASAGPLTRFVSGEAVSWATAWHSATGRWLVIALAALHILAVFYYAVFRREPLVRPMISGDKFTPHAAIASRDDTRSRVLALVLFGLCAALAWWVASLRA